MISEIANWLVIIGALNWGLFAISRKAELVHYLKAKWLVTLVYALVGLAGLWQLLAILNLIP